MDYLHDIYICTFNFLVKKKKKEALNVLMVQRIIFLFPKQSCSKKNQIVKQFFHKHKYDINQKFTLSVPVLKYEQAREIMQYIIREGGVLAGCFSGQKRNHSVSATKKRSHRYWEVATNAHRLRILSIDTDSTFLKGTFSSSGGNVCDHREACLKINMLHLKSTSPLAVHPLGVVCIVQMALMQPLCFILETWCDVTVLTRGQRKHS